MACRNNDDGPVSYLPAPGEEPDDSATHLTDERLSSLIASGGLLADLFTTQPLGAGSPDR
ncbi:MAG: hypothetical protein IRZ08_12360 [Frankia sp.]|nr:hypothetical protein [Frankia sp.]